MPTYKIETVGNTSLVGLPISPAGNVTVRCWGGGGGGGGGQNYNASPVHLGPGYAGGGGGGGAYAESVNVSIVSDMRATVGAGGTGGGTTGSDGASGGASSLTRGASTYCLAAGGGGGGGGASADANNRASGGTGGAVADCTGDTAFRGGNGTPNIFPVPPGISTNRFYGGCGAGAGRPVGSPDAILNGDNTVAQTTPASGYSGPGTAFVGPTSNGITVSAPNVYGSGGGGGGGATGNSFPIAGFGGDGLSGAVHFIWGQPGPPQSSTAPSTAPPGALSSTGRFMAGIRTF